MTSFLEKYFNRLFFTICSVVFVVICLRAFFIPFSHDEALTFFFYVQSGDYLPYKAHVYTNNHVLNSALAHLCYLVAGSHKFVLRLPNILSFLVLCYAVFKYFRYINQVWSKLILTALFILTFNFLDFFELCRGYGLSMGFMLLGLAFLQDYFTDKQYKSLLLFSLFLQLALSANLILVVLLVLLLFFVIIFQVRNKLLFNLKTLVLHAVNFGLLIFWIKFSLFYRDKGSLDSGFGDDYWEVTFKSLMLLIYGTDYLWIQLLLVCVFLVVLLTTVTSFFKKTSINAVFEPRFFYLAIFVILIVSFYLQKRLLDVNFPENRTGLFFYVFFALSVVFFFDSFAAFFSAPSASLILSASVIYFIASFNLTTFTHWFYYVIPKRIYTHLQEEYKKDPQFFTIGGLKEMNYAFLNYRAKSMFNPMDPSLEMQMNCDYYYAYKFEEPYYRFFYDEIDRDDKGEKVLLKRKQKIERTELRQFSIDSKSFKGKDEWFGFLQFGDSALKTRNCLELDVMMHFEKVPKPFNASLVLQVNDTNNNAIYYERISLNWIESDLNGKFHRFKINCGQLPEHFGSVNVHVWNFKKEDVEFSIHDLKIYELKAPGINFVIPKEYYPLIQKVTNVRLF